MPKFQYFENGEWHDSRYRAETLCTHNELVTLQNFGHIRMGGHLYRYEPQSLQDYLLPAVEIPQARIELAQSLLMDPPNKLDKLPKNTRENRLRSWAMKQGLLKR